MKKLRRIPKLSSRKAWHKVFAEYDLGPISNDLLIELFDHWVGRDTRIVNGVVRRLTAETERILRQFLGRDMRDMAEEAIDQVRQQMNTALIKPHSPNGKAIRDDFASLVANRGKDARRKERRQSFKESPIDIVVPDYDDRAQEQHDGSEEEAVIRGIDLERFLHRIPDETLRTIIKLRYIDLTYEEIAEIVHPDRDAAKAKHSVRKAVAAFLKAIKEADDGDEGDE